ncbi:MAG: hypothetical protein IT305_00995 [Chloroflexi bacterium]|nr:hypothetical protein [Chloroflexota bacterium]
MAGDTISHRPHVNDLDPRIGAYATSIRRQEDEELGAWSGIHLTGHDECATPYRPADKLRVHLIASGGIQMAVILRDVVNPDVDGPEDIQCRRSATIVKFRLIPIRGRPLPLADTCDRPDEHFVRQIRQLYPRGGGLEHLEGECPASQAKPD